MVAADDGKQNQEDLMVFSIIQGSLETPILEAYSYCETSKELWKTLQKVYGNIFNLNRIFEVKKAISTLHQEDSDFTQHFGKFRALWAELEMLMPTTVEASVLNDRREQDKVFALFLTLHPSYNDLIKHILRAEKLPTFEEVCAQIQKEQGSVSLFGGKSELDLGNQAEGTANRGSYKAEHKKIWICDHCKKKGHGRDKYWILHPHLKPQKFRTPQPDAKSHFSGGMGEPSGSGSTHSFNHPNAASEGKVSASGNYNTLSSAYDDTIKRSGLDALIKAVKKNFGNTFGTSLNACVDGISLNASDCSKLSKPVVIDSGASHHMISDLGLISNIVSAFGNVMVANADKVPIKGVGDLKLFSKDSKVIYMSNLTSNLLSVK